jgi:hypothetical protein
MRTYWSNSKFAAHLREVFGLPALPPAATMEGWDEHEKASLKASKFGVTVIESLNTLQKVIFWVPNTLESASYFVANVVHKSHVLRTRTKFGKWSDLTSRIPDALMLSIIDFVEEECFWMNVCFCSHEDKSKLEPEVRKYLDQSYIRRKLYRVKVSDTVRAKHAREWMDFQNAHDPHEVKAYDELWEAYLFAKNRYLTFDSFEESGYNAYSASKGVESLFTFRNEPETDALFKKIHELEDEFETQVEKFCTVIVKHHRCMWT